MTTASPLLDGRVEENLELRVAKHLRAHVAPVGDQAGRDAHALLDAAQRLAHLREPCDRGRSHADALFPDRRRHVHAVDADRPGILLDDERGRHAGQAFGVVQRHPPAKRGPGDDAIERPAVEQPPAQALRDAGRDRALAGAARSVDRDDRGGLATVSHRASCGVRGLAPGVRATLACRRRSPAAPRASRPRPARLRGSRGGCRSRSRGPLRRCG